MERLYFNPGCALSIYKPQAEQQILALLQAHGIHAKLHRVCCRHQPGLPAGSRIINVCAGCHRRFGSLYPGVSTISLWEVLDGLDEFPFPNYGGLTLSVHDPCPVRDAPQVHAAVRSLLAKMNLRVDEAPLHGTNSVCCGDCYYPARPIEEIQEKMRQRAQSMPREDVAVYCVSCIKAMHIGGKRPRHLVDLLLGQETQPQVYETKAWHDQLEAYIVLH